MNSLKKGGRLCIYLFYAGIMMSLSIGTTVLFANVFGKPETDIDMVIYTVSGIVVSFTVVIIVILGAMFLIKSIAIQRNDKIVIFKHPELQAGEEFYCNVHNEQNFIQLNFETKRIGRVAYSGIGVHIKPLIEGGGPFPVFVQKSELEELEDKDIEINIE